MLGATEPDEGANPIQRTVSDRGSRSVGGRVLVVHISGGDLSSFVRRDADILRSSFSVTTLSFRGKFDIFSLARAVSQTDVVVCWFAWDNAFWSSLVAPILGRRVVVIAGGFDVVSFPEIGYGNLLHAGSARRTRFALRRADLVLAVSKSICKDAQLASGRDDIRLVYHGFDETEFPLGEDKKRIALTVGDVTESNLTRKGLKCFVDAARHAPDVRFLVVGRSDKKAVDLLGSLPKNVSLLGRLSDADVRSVMKESQVYVQVSAHEGFGCSLAEAMLCGCIPVVTDRGALPEVAGETGFYVKYGDPHDTASGILEAIQAGESSSRAARARISRLFPLGKRKEAVIDAVLEVM